MQPLPYAHALLPHLVGLCYTLGCRMFPKADEIVIDVHIAYASKNHPEKHLCIHREFIVDIEPTYSVIGTSSKKPVWTDRLNAMPTEPTSLPRMPLTTDDLAIPINVLELVMFFCKDMCNGES